MAIFEQVSEDIKKAMLAKERTKLDALRGIKKELLEAKIAKSAQAELSDEVAISVIQKMAKQRRDAAEIYKQQNREDLAQKELEELEVIETYLPKQLSEEELKQEVEQIIKELGASTLAELGKVMGVASKKLAGVTHGKAISDMVKKLLS